MEEANLTELAALYALDALDNNDLGWVEDALDQNSDLAIHIEDFQTVAAELAYGVEMVPMSANLKDRLFQRLTTESFEPPADVIESVAQPAIADLINQAKTVTWEPYQPTPGAVVGTLGLDLEKREVQCFVRSWGSAAFPEHRHASHEEITVLEGDLMIGDRVYRPGDRILSTAGTQHQPKTLTGCLIFLQTSIDDVLVDND
jgi:hypothetical protein